MAPTDDGRPRVERSARGLGIRVGKDIVAGPDGVVHPGTGGMSVAPCSLWNLPNHRRPRPLGRGSTGTSEDRVYSLDLSHVWRTTLAVRADARHPFTHALVEPGSTTTLARFEGELAMTQSRWKQVWP